jgi:hypothetical protein
VSNHTLHEGDVLSVEHPVRCHLCNETKGSFRLVHTHVPGDGPEGSTAWECLSHWPKRFLRLRDFRGKA